MSAQARIIGGHLGAGYHSWEQPKSTVTESGVRLLTAQKPMKRQAWWNGKFALFQRPATRGEGGLLPENQLPIAAQGTGVLKGEFQDCISGGRKQNNMVSSDSHLKISNAVV